MSLLDLPIPPKPAAFTPEGAPPGVAIDFDSQWAFKPDGKTPDKSRRYWQSRPKIKPRVAIVHTNAAENEGSTQSAINYGNVKASHTHPTYAVNWPTCVKLLPSDRRSVANATEDWYERQESQTDASFWTLSIETADTGTKADPSISDFLTVSKYGAIEVRHDEIVARILAYESIVWGFPLEAPKEWDGTGVAAHTHPFPHPAYTTQEGKTCPGPKKIKALWDRILPRARQIRAAWLDDTPPTPEEDDMKDSRLWRPKGYLNIFIITPSGNVLHASQALLTAYGIPTTNIIEDDHPQTLLSMLRLAGLTVGDLVKA